MIPKPHSALAELRRLAEDRKLVDYGATARALAERETKLQYKTWRNIGDAGNPNFNSPWQNLDINAAGAFEPLTGEGRNAAGFFRDRWGFVHVRGVVQNTSGMDTGTIFTLPGDLVPVATEYFRSYYVSNGTGGLSGTTFRWACVVKVTTSGAMSVQEYYTTTTTGGVKLLSLENIAFQAYDRGQF